MDSRLQKRAGARVLASLAGAFLLAAGVLKADTLTWTASGGGMWSHAANWSSDGSHTVPQSGDTIKILGLKSGEVYENDIDGLSTPHLEFGGSTDSPYPQVKGKQVTLTGGMNALKTASGRIANYLPLVLTVQNGNPTNQFTNPGRLVQYAIATTATTKTPQLTQPKISNCHNENASTDITLAKQMRICYHSCHETVQKKDFRRDSEGRTLDYGRCCH